MLDLRRVCLQPLGASVRTSPMRGSSKGVLSPGGVCVGVLVGVLAVGSTTAFADRDTSVVIEQIPVLEPEKLTEPEVSDLPPAQVEALELAAVTYLANGGGKGLQGNFEIAGQGNLNGVLNRASTTALGPIVDGVTGDIIGYEYLTTLQRPKDTVLVLPSPYVPAIQELDPRLRAPERIRVKDLHALMVAVDIDGSLRSISYWPAGADGQSLEVERIGEQIDVRLPIDEHGELVRNGEGLVAVDIEGKRYWLSDTELAGGEE